MDYEKAYKEALERAREYWETDNDNTLDIKAKGTMEHLFPELAESEDEKIRKELHIYLDWLDGRKDYAPRGEYSIRDMIAWLEKLKVFAEHGDGLYCFANSEFTYVGNSYSGVSVSHDNGVDIIFDKKPVKHISNEKQGKQKYALDIEIPFGAKDSELQEATYLIPEGFHAEIKDDEVLIKKGKQKPAWSEADDEELKITINALKNIGHYNSADWLITLKERIGG